jgi:hypothetical protein
MRRFLQIARGSANEVEHHLLLSRDLQLLSVDDFKELEAMVLETQGRLASFVQRLSVDVLARNQWPEARNSLTKLVATTAFMLASKPVTTIRGHIV